MDFILIPIQAARPAKCLRWPALLLFGSLLRGQELRPLTPYGSGNHDAIQSDSDGTPGHEFHYGPIGGHLTFSSSLTYDDNINIVPDHKMADLIWKFSPGITLGAGDYLQQEESWLTFDYAPTFVVFAKNEQDDAVDQNARLNFEWKPAYWTFGLKQEYLRLSEPVVEIGDRVERDSYDTHLYARYEYSPKTAFELNASQSINDYPLPLFSYNLWTASTWIDYWTTPKIKVGLGLLGGVMTVSQNPGQTYEQALFRAEYDMSENVEFQGYVGGERRQFDGGFPARWNYTFSLAANLQLTPNTGLSLSAYRRDENSLIAVGQNYTITGVSASVRQVVFDKYTLTLTGGYDHTDYYSTEAVTDTHWQYNYLFLRPSVICQITNQLVLELFYQFQKNDSQAGNAFEDNQVGLKLTYHF